MDTLIALVAIAILVAPIALGGAWMARGLPNMFSWQPDRWPIGVQEEDIDHPWGQGAERPEAAKMAEAEIVEVAPWRDLGGRRPEPRRVAAVTHRRR